MAGVNGRGSAGHMAMVAMMVAVGLLTMAPAANATTHLVGGATQNWNYASNGYSYDVTWSPSQTFVVGDILEFKYTTGQHNVVQYATKAEYDACAGTAVHTWTTGDDMVPLNSTGTMYYICSYPGHCGQGMKVSVNVAAAATPPTVAPASPPTTTPSPPPPTTPSPPNGASSGPILSMAGLLGAALVAGLAFLV